MKFVQCKGSLEPTREARDRCLSLLTGTKNREGAQCSRVAAHGLCWQRVTNGILICTGEGRSHPFPHLVLGFLSSFCLACLATKQQGGSSSDTSGTGFPTTGLTSARLGTEQGALRATAPGTASSFGFGVTCKERAFTGR